MCFELISRMAMHLMQVTIKTLSDEQKAGVNMTSLTAVEGNTVRSWVEPGSFRTESLEYASMLLPSYAGEICGRIREMETGFLASVSRDSTERV